MSIASGVQVSEVFDGNVNATIKKAKAAIASATTDGAVVTAVANKKLRVVGFHLSCGATATAITFNSKPAGAGSAISATYSLAINGVFGSCFNPGGWFDTVAGEGLTATTGTGGTVNVQVTYVEVN